MNKKKNINIKFVILTALLVLAGVVAIYSLDKNIFFPWDTSLSLSRPYVVAIDDNQKIRALVNDDGTSLVSLDANENVIATESIKGGSNLDYYSNVEFFDNKIYVTLVSYNTNKMTINNEQIICYDKYLISKQVLYTFDHDNEDIDYICMKRFEKTADSVYCVIASGTYNEKFQVVNLVGNVELVQNEELNIPRSEITVSDYNPTCGRFVAASADGTMIIVDDDGTSQQIVCPPDISSLQAITVSDNGAIYLTLLSDNNVYCLYKDHVCKCLQGVGASALQSKTDLFVSDARQDRILRYYNATLLQNLNNHTEDQTYDLMQNSDEVITSFKMSPIKIIYNIFIIFCYAYIAVAIIYFAIKLVRIVSKKNKAKIVSGFVSAILVVCGISIIMFYLNDQIWQDTNSFYESQLLSNSSTLAFDVEEQYKKLPQNPTEEQIATLLEECRQSAEAQDEAFSQSNFVASSVILFTINDITYYADYISAMSSTYHEEIVDFIQNFNVGGQVTSGILDNDRIKARHMNIAFSSVNNAQGERVGVVFSYVFD